MASKVGSIYTEIRARLDKLDSDFKKAHNISQNSARKIQSSIDKISFDKVGASVAKFTRLFNTAALPWLAAVPWAESYRPPAKFKTPISGFRKRFRANPTRW